MAWNQFLQLFFGGTLIVAQSVPKPLPTLPPPDDTALFDCGRSVANLLSEELTPGPVFAREDLVFTSVEANDHSRWLVLTAGAGTYAVRLERQGVNRLSFTLPTRGTNFPRRFYLSYLHDAIIQSRIFDFGLDRTPAGRNEDSYEWVQASRADQMLPQLAYKIHETAEAALALVTEGRVERSQLRQQDTSGCANLRRESANVAESLKRNLDTFELIAGTSPITQPTRQPAGLVRPLAQ